MKKGIAILLALLLSCTVTGCSETEPSALAIVWGGHSNFPGVPAQKVYDDVYESVYNYGNVSVVSSEGEPRVVGNFQVSQPDKHIDGKKRSQLAQNNTEQILASLAEVTAQTPEIDTLGALALAADMLRASGCENRTLILADSGLSTTSLLDFSSSNLLEEDPASLVEQLEALHAIPDLSGVRVKLYGLGQVCGAQERLTSDAQYKLSQIWMAILTAGEAQDVSIDTTVLAETQDTTGLPACSTVAIAQDALTAQSVMRFDQSSVGFLGNQAVFSDEKAAAAALLPTARYLAQHPGQAVYLAGMTDSSRNDVPLSLARAEACKEILVTQGAAESQIECVGLGSSANPLRVRDMNQDGTLNGNASKNRAVFLFLRGSTTARQLGLE